LTTFVDTSALYALLDRRDPAHSTVARTFDALSERPLLTHNYVVVEAAALLGRRFGVEAVRQLVEILGPIDVAWVDEPTHQAALGAYLAAAPTAPSLVDLTSFEVMRRLGIRTALAIDRDFADAGFDVVPGA